MVNRIKELRNAAGLTLEQLAERAGCSKDQVWRLEKGDRHLTDEWMRALAKALGCRASDFLPEEDFSPRLSELEMTMLAEFRKLSDANRRRMLGLSAHIGQALADVEADTPPETGDLTLIAAAS